MQNMDLIFFHCSMADISDFLDQPPRECNLCESHIRIDWFCTTCDVCLCEKCKNLHTKKHTVVPSIKDGEIDNDNGEF